MEFGNPVVDVVIDFSAVNVDAVGPVLDLDVRVVDHVRFEGIVLG